jgi:hypothetical protein
MPAETALVVSPDQVVQGADFFMPAFTFEEATARRAAFHKYVTSQLRDGVDFGGIGVGKLPALRKPGAEKLSTFFGLIPHDHLIDKIEDWSGAQHGGQPLFAYTTRVDLFRHGQLVAGCTGHCNTWESRYRWRWVTQDQVPRGLKTDDLQRRDSTIEEFTFAVEKKETVGPYAKPAEYWAMFEEAIQSGRARKIKKQTSAGKEYPAWQIAGTQFRVPNPDPYDGINSAIKISYKRAYVGAVLIATNASDFFTTDLDDTDTDDTPPAKPGVPAEEEREYQPPPSQSRGTRPTEPGTPPKPAPPAEEEIPLALQKIFAIMTNGSREDRLAQFKQVEGYLFETMGEPGGEMYRETLARHGVEHPGNFKSLGAARRCMADLWKLCEAQQKAEM